MISPNVIKSTTLVVAVALGALALTGCYHSTEAEKPVLPPTKAEVQTKIQQVQAVPSINPAAKRFITQTLQKQAEGAK